MNCLEVRRRLLQDPYRKDSDLLAHEANCHDCAVFSRKLRKEEATLRALLHTPSAPPGLAESIRLGIQLERRSDTGLRLWLTAAASVLLAVGISMASLFTERYERGHMPLAQNVIYHIEDEAKHLHDPGPASPQRVKAVLSRFGAELVGDIGQVSFAAECVMRNRTGVHLILRGQQGPVTVFFMPHEQPHGMIPLESGRFQGEIVPMRWGALAVIGEHGETIESIMKRVEQGVRWPEDSSTEALAGNRFVTNRRIAQVQL